MSLSCSERLARNGRSGAEQLVSARMKFTVCYSLVVSLITLSLVATAIPAEVFTLSYHRVVDNATYAKNPAKYETAAYRHPATENEVYIERQPSLQIMGAGIESVTVRKSKIYGDSPGEREDFKRFIMESLRTKPGEKRKQPENYPHGFSYTLTFKLKPSEWKKEQLFSKNNLEQWYHIKMGIHDVGITLFGPMDDEVSEKKREFTLYIPEGDANKIKDMLSPIKDKVSWE